MAYNEFLADRIRVTLKGKHVAYEEKEMMGGLTFMVDGKMCVGIVKEEMMARIGPDFEEEALAMKGCRVMDFTKRPLKGYVFISNEGTDMDEDLEFWVDKALEYNPKAKSSKKKKK
ncbi:MAG: TfoX/Sxy family protein [Bacteroidales bacterium]|nr:TfoX/Sxy family protein [Bacteroidales bacterium]